MRRAHALPDDCVHMCVLPAYHASALYRNVFIPFSQGSPVVMAKGFNAESFWRLVDTFGVGYVQGVPAILASLAVHPSDPGPRARQVLRFIGSASAPLEPQLIQRFEERFGIPIAQAYGLTETSCGLCFNDPRVDDRRLDSVGHPIDIVDLKIVDPEGAPVPAGEVGEIVISGPMVMKGYLDDEDAGKRLEGQTLYTGDLGRRDARGLLTVEGRTTDIVHRAGFKVSPREVEEALTDIPGVITAVAFGVPHETLGEDLLAVVRYDGETFDENALRDRLLTSMAGYKVPTRIQRITGDYKAEEFKKSRALFRRRYVESRCSGDHSAPQAGAPESRGLADRPRAFLAGEGVYLRPLMRTDLDNPDYLNAVMNPQAQAHTMAGMFPQSEIQMVGFWEGLQPPDGAIFAVCRIDGDRHVGNILMRIDWISKVGEFGRLMFPGCGDAVGSDEAMGLLMAYAFRDLGLRRLWGQGSNPASVPSLVRLGFTLEGRLRRHVFRRGESHDVFAFGMLAEEYEALRRGARLTSVPATVAPPGKKPSAGVRDVVAAAFGIEPGFDPCRHFSCGYTAVGLVRCGASLASAGGAFRRRHPTQRLCDRYVRRRHRRPDVCQGRRPLMSRSPHRPPLLHPRPQARS